MMTRRLKCRVKIFSLLIAVVLFMGSQMRDSVYAGTQIPMPKGLENVYLGMTLDELKAVRPNLERDDWPYSTMYYEINLKNDFFTFVSYDFSWSKLTEITLSETTTSEDFARVQIPGLVVGCIRKWGTDYILKTSNITRKKTQKKYLVPLFYWDKTTAKIQMRYADTGYEIYIFDPSLDPILKFGAPADSLNGVFGLEGGLNVDTYQGLVFE